MNTIYTWLLQFFAQPDKFLHFIVCYILIIGLLFLGLDVIPSLWVCFFVAWAKEILYDKKRPSQHSVDGWDAYATVAGALAGLTTWAYVLSRYV